MNLSDIKKHITSKVDKSELAKRLYKGISWTLIGNIIGKFLQLVAFIFVARIVGKEEYGQVGIIRSTLNMFLLFSSAGMGATATRYIAIYRTSDPNRAYQIYRFSLKVVLAIGFVVSLIVFLMSDQIAEKYLNDVNLGDALRVGAFTLFLMTLTSVQTGALNGFERFRSLGINLAANGLILFVSVIVGAYLRGVNGVVAGLAISNLIYAVQLWFSLKNDILGIRHAEQRPNIERLSKSSVFLKFSLPAVLESVTIVAVLWWAKTFLIGIEGYGEMAIYDVAEQWYFVILFIPNSMTSILLPLLINTNYNGSKKQYDKLLNINLLLNTGIAFIISLVVYLFLPLIFRFYGKGFNDFRPLIVLLVAVVICAANNVVGQIIVSKGKMWIGFGVNVLRGFWLVLFTFLFVGHYRLGALGLAYAFLLSYILHSIVQGFIAVRIKNHNFDNII